MSEHKPPPEPPKRLEPEYESVGLPPRIEGWFMLGLLLCIPFVIMIPFFARGDDFQTPLLAYGIFLAVWWSPLVLVPLGLGVVAVRMLIAGKG